MKRKSTLSWVFEFAGRKIKYFGWSVVLAIFGVALSFAPYLIISDMVVQLLDGNKEWNYYLNKILLIFSIGVDEKTAAKDACRIEHVLSDETFEALKNIRAGEIKKLK